MRTVILSDCHLGSTESNHEMVNERLRAIKRDGADRLVLLGDFWDIWDASPRRLRREYADTILLLRGIIDGGTKVDLVLGNHDEEYLSDPIMPLSEVDVMTRSEVMTRSGRRMALCHGHEFDPLHTRWHAIGRLMEWINRLVGNMFGVSLKTIKRLTRRSCTDLEGARYSRSVEKIHKRAMRGNSEYDGLVMGHTHSPTHEIAAGRMEFANAGDWKWSNTYVVIEDDDVRLMCHDGRRIMPKL